MADAKQLRPASRLAVAVAREGELAEPRIPAPAGLRQVLRFSRLSTAAYDTIRRAVDEDEGFRARVAAAADESEVGRAGWLWLHRPDGWEADPALATDADDPAGGGAPPAARPKRERAAADAQARLRQAADKAEAARRKAADQAATARREADDVRAERDDLKARLHVLGDERNHAVRTLKDREAALAAARRDLKVARQAAREAEAELLARREMDVAVGANAGASGDRSKRRGAKGGPSVPAEPGSAVAGAEAVAGATDARDGRPVEPFDQAGARAAVAAAAAAAADLSTALARAAGALAPPAAAPPVASPSTPGAGPSTGPRSGSRRAPGTGRAHRPARSRVLPALPPGVFDGSREAHRHLLAAGDALLVVDGYNVARAAWSGLAPEEERRRTIALLEEVGARAKMPVVVVFDGDDTATAPPASRAVRVRFSPTGVTADDVIAELVAELPPSQPVVVVSSDRQVGTDARAQGAVVVGSTDFLAAAGR